MYKNEEGYLTLVLEIINRAPKRTDRTGVGTRSIFGPQVEYDLTESFPLFTTKRVFFRGVVEELLWMISGKTDAKELAERGVHIWDANGSRQFLDRRGLTENVEGDLGPVYGFQWRHFGAEYKGCDADYTGKGTDQLAECIRLIKEDPYSRRIVMSAWNPADLSKMALPPCHMFCQFYVQNGELSCMLYQRSADMGLGVPFNVASYALLTHIIAKIAGLKPVRLVHTIGDAHVYLNHVEGLTEQCRRDIRYHKAAQLVLPDVIESIDALRPEDISITGYDPHPTIRLPMAE